jgi:hypothetical protein
MRKRAQKSNKQFLIGTATMAFAVGFIVVIFLLMCARHAKYQNVSFKDLYQIGFAKGFVGDSAIVYLNDSLVWNDIVHSDTTQIRIHRFADENTIMVSRSHEDAVSIFNIDKKAGRIILHRENGIVSMSTLGW